MSTPDCSNDKSPDAYEKVVDRLLASPRYGERMASRWMDSARYADFNKSDRAHHDQNDGRKDETIGFKDGSPRYVESPLGRGVAFDGKLYFDAGRRAGFRMVPQWGEDALRVETEESPPYGNGGTSP